MGDSEEHAEPDVEEDAGRWNLPAYAGGCEGAEAPGERGVILPLPAQGAPVRAQPIRPPDEGGVSYGTNMKEALGRYFALMVFAGDPTFSLGPLLYMVHAMLHKKGAEEKYKDKIASWEKREATAVNGWNRQNGQWKISNLTSERVIGEILSVCLDEDIIILNRKMFDDISDLVLRGAEGVTQ